MTTATAPAPRVDPGQEPRSQPSRARSVAFVLLSAVFIAVTVLLRFWTRSPLWLDEAQSVAIARLPLSGHGMTIWAALRHDGSPPLYYLLLHGWISLFGTGSLAVRALSGVLSLASFPLLWLLGRILVGRRAAIAAVLLLASSPFDVRFATETRMYSLLVVLALVGGLALHRILTEGPGLVPVLGLALISGGLALTHYWSFYLLLTVSGGLVALALRRPAHRRRAGWSLSGIGLGALVFAPWLPAFGYQLAHTGTPWGEPAGFAAVVHAFGEWTGGPSAIGRALLLVIAALLVLAVFGTPVDRRHVLLDLRGRDPGRWLLGLTLGTLVVAIAVGQLVGNAWADRYTATAFVPFLLVAGLGVTALQSRRLAAGTVAIACLLGFAESAADITTNRTSAGRVAAVINRVARPGDIVLTCPDQLGPALSRLVRPGIPVLGVPTLTPSARVDWVDYAARQRAAKPAVVAAAALRRVTGSGQVFLVEAAGYRTYDSVCPGVSGALAAARPAVRTLVTDPAKTYEHEELLLFPTRAGGR